MPVEFAGIKTTRAGIKPVTFGPEELDSLVTRWNGRYEITEEAVIEMAHLIASSPVGQQVLGSVRKGEGGKAEVIEGNKRLLGIRYINSNLSLFQSLYPATCKGPFPFKAIILDCNEDEMIELNLASNLDRKGLSPMDRAVALRDMEKRGWPEERIAHALRCSRSSLGILRSYLTLPAEAQRDLHLNFETNGAEGITGQLASALVGMPDKDVKATLEKVEAGEVKSSEAVRQVNKKKRAAGQRVSMTLKELMDELREHAEDGKSMLAFDLYTLLQGQHDRTLREILDDWEPEKDRVKGGRR